MTRRIIILERINLPSDRDYRYLFWADRPAARQSHFADPAATSVFPNATPAEIAAIQSGAIAEFTGIWHVTTGQTLAQIMAQLVTAFNLYQATITANNPLDYYGSYWDGSTWTSVTTS